MIVPILTALAFHSVQAEPLRGSLSYEGNDCFRLTLENVSKRNVAVCLYSDCYELVVRNSKGELVSSLDRYLSGGTAADGTIYYPPSQLIISDTDWMKLRPHMKVSMLLSSVDFAGAAPLPDRGTATVKYRPEQTEDLFPDWVASEHVSIAELRTIKPIAFER